MTKLAKGMTFIKQNTITREYLSRSIRRYTDLNIAKASVVVDKIIEAMIFGITQDKNVKIRMFGSFSVKKKAERIGRNPKNMKPAIIKSRRILNFKAAPTFKNKINSNIDSINLVKPEKK